MTRNIGQWMYSSTASSLPACASDELCLLRHGQPPRPVVVQLHAKRRNQQQPVSGEPRQPRCVSWAPGLFETASSVLPGSRDHRRKVTRSWYGGQSCSGVSPAHIGPKVGPYGSFTTTTASAVAADSGDLICTPPQSQPLLLSPAAAPPHRPPTIQIQKTPTHQHQAQRSSPPATVGLQPPNITITPVPGNGPPPGTPTTPPLPVKTKASRPRGIDLIMPSLRSLVSRRGASGSTTSLTALSSDGLPTIVVEGPGGGLRKCETAIALSAASSRTTLLAEPLQATNRLRVGGRGSDALCSRCSSLLSLATSGSRYSLNTAAGTFVPVPPVLCKLCLIEVPHSETCTLQQCACSFCKDCMQAYVSFEIVEGAYDISCPDAQCPAQGVVTLVEIEHLVDANLVEKHKKYRLNREVDIDKTRTWCPRAGCETVCKLCPTERCSPQSVHCPTCSSDFCSNCKQNWHGNTTCEDQARLDGNDQTLGIPFDSDLIKCCPMCNVPIEKDEGCAQMMCKRCKHVFCWYCLASLDDDFLLRHYDKGPCKNKLGHSRASVIWHRTQVIGIFAGFGILLLVASPLLLLAAPCIVCCKCRVCNSNTKLDNDEEIPEESAS